VMVLVIIHHEIGTQMALTESTTRASRFDVHGQPEAYRRIVERKGQRLMADGIPVSQTAGKSY